MPSVIRLPQVPALSWDDCRLLVESVQDYAVFMLDVDGHVATWNRGAQLIKGYEPEEIVGKHFSVFYPPEAIAARKPEQELIDARRDGRVSDEGWRIRKDGSRFWASVIITALRDESGRLRGFGKVTRDLTDRRMAEEELRRSEERLRLLIDAVSDYAIYMLDLDGRVTTWNPGAERTKGYKAEEVIGRHFSMFFPPEAIKARKPELELELAVQVGRFEEEGFRVRKDGTHFWANVVITPIRDNKGYHVGFAKITRDLSDRLQAEETARSLIREQAARAASQASESRLRQAAELAERAAKRAEEASRIKDEFLATVSHELRTPLNAILGWAAVLNERGAAPSQAKGLEVIHRNALAQAKIIDDILDVSRIITGQLRLDLRQADLRAIVGEAIEVVSPAAAAKRLSVTVKCAEEVYPLVADSIRIQQVVWNLLSNAVKFSEPDGLITVHLSREGASLVLSVADTGRGLDPAFIPHMFEAFRQEDSSTTRGVGGLGLGLAIVRHILEMHGGQVKAHSAGLGHGTTVTVILPARSITAPDRPRSLPADEITSAHAQAHKPSLQGVRVLVVDDEPDARELLQSVLSSSGAQVEAAGSAAEALQILQRFRPHVLISDIGMPGEDGHSLIRRVRALGEAEGGNIPAIALTAYTQQRNQAAALAAGFTAHVGKPVSPNEVLLVVAKLVPTVPS